ncbi:MAG: glycosyl hydrolase [Armatimonadia bacterium]
MSTIIAQYFLNHRLDPDELRWQMREIAEQGYDGVYAHARPGMLTPYFSADWWRACDTLVECCESLGLQFWIWDDDFFPSGLCGGRVVWSDPSLAARDLRFKIAEFDGSGPFELDLEPGLLVRAYALTPGAQEATDLTPFTGTRRQNWPWRSLLHRAYSPGINPVGPPHWRDAHKDNQFCIVWTPPQPGRYTLVGVTTGVCSDTHPDLLRPEGIASYLKINHEEYATRYADRFGRSIVGSFTDEPSPGALLFPWSPGFDAEFQRDHGYSLLDHLPHLALDLGDRSPLIRHHYRQTQHRLVKTNYVDQVGDWLHSHNLQHVGHLTRTEWLCLTAVWWPNEIRCYDAMDIPMADPLGAGVGYVDAAAYHTGLKVVSSAAHLFGKEQAGADCFAVIGDEANLRELKYLADYHLAMGINHFALHGLSYSNDGPRKDEVPPSLSYQHTQWQQMHVWLDDLKRTAAALTGGKHQCQIAMLYPSTSLYCQSRPDTDWMQHPDEPLIHSVSETLLSHQRDFDLIDELTVQEQTDAEGRLNTPEPYQTIILPYLRYLDANTAAALDRFQGHGGQIIALGRRPQLLGDLNTPLRDWQTPALHAELTADLISTLPGPDVQGDGARDVFVLSRERDGQPVSFLFNRSTQWFHGTLDGTNIALPPRQGRLLDDARELAAAPASGTALDLSSGWEVTFQPNHLPLSFWHVHTSEPKLSVGPTGGQTYDLMQRQTDPAGPGENEIIYYCRFMLSGEIPDARLVSEDSAIAGNWRLYVNDVEITDWRRARVYDCLNLEADVAHALRTGTSPMLNLVKIVTSGPGRGLTELPYLYGSFTAQYRYAHLSFPFVAGADSTLALPNLQPWNALGYPTFSGTATYRRTLDVPEAGTYLLDLGRVEDTAVVRVNGTEIAALGWEPYRCQIALPTGQSVLEVAVSNPPANRNRGANMPAGLLGPVTLTRLGASQ